MKTCTIADACHKLGIPLPVSRDDLKRTAFAIWDARLSTNVDRDCLKELHAEWIAGRNYRDAITGRRPSLTRKLVDGLTRKLGGSE